MNRRTQILVALAAAGLLLCTRLPCAEQQKPARLVVSGTPEQMGEAFGRQCGETIRKLHPLFLGSATLATGHTKGDLYRCAQDIEKHIAKEDVREMRALAEAAGMPYEDVLFLNVWYTLSINPMFCRQLALWGKWTRDGELIHARNLDWPDYPGSPLCRNNLILNVKPTDGIEYVTLAWPGLVCVLTGTNRKGVTLAFNQLPNGPARGRVAEPTFFTLKRALRTCGSVDEVVKLIQDAKPLGNGSILVSDAQRKRAVVVDVFDANVGVREAAECIIGNANHVTTELGRDDVRAANIDWPACGVATMFGKPLVPDDVRRVMADSRVILPINIVSVVFMPSQNRMLLSCGRLRAAEGEFTEYELFPTAEAPAPPAKGGQ
jgi:hypothetical protein